MAQRGKAPFAAVPVKYSVTRLGGGVTSQGVSYPGGLDLTTPSLSLQPGACRDALNFECSQTGGYARIQGYERFSGLPSPSVASFGVVQVVSFTNLPAVGNTITQAVSGATGKVIAIVNSGGVSYIVVTKVTGVFDITHNITVGATPIGTAIVTSASITALLNAQYKALAADVYRADIAAVPGSGPILGVVAMTFANVDFVYAFRANVGATAVAIYKSTAAGWVLVPFYKTVSFTVGNIATPADGAILTQGAVTATVKRVVQQSGAWTGTAAGQFVITTPSGGGGNFAAGAATLTGGATVTLSGVQTDITMLPGGKFEFDKGNFSGQQITRRIYGADSVNKCFEFDGDTLVPIATGYSPDNPKFIRVHKNFLFVSKDSSISYSGVGTPYKWGTVSGGGEIATGDEVTGFITLPGNQTTAALGVFLRNDTAILYGTDPTAFNFVLLDQGTGAIPYSCQNLSDTFVLDSLGVVTLKTTLNYGNFLSSTLTKNILPFIQQERSKLTSSCLSRGKNQYRLFFNDGFGLYITSVNDQYFGAMPVLFPNPVNVSDEATNASFNLVSYFGSTDSNGYVYQFDMGTSFDGANIDAHITLAWDAIKTPRILKRFRTASIEIQSSFYANISFGYLLGYATQNIGQPINTDYASNFSGIPVWDQFFWDNFIWDGQTLLPTDVDMTGTAENVQTIISSTTNYIDTYTLNSIIYHYTPRRGIRN